MLKIIFLKNIILMHFRVKNTLKYNRNHTFKHAILYGETFRGTKKFTGRFKKYHSIYITQFYHKKNCIKYF